MERKINYSLPFIFKVQNLTDEKIFNVKLLENTDNRVLVEYGVKDVTMENFKKQIEINCYTIGNTYVEAIMDYWKFVIKQLHSRIVVWQYFQNGTSYTFPLDISYDAYQTNLCFASSKQEYQLNYCADTKTKLILDFLMPEMQLYVKLYPVEK